MTDEQIQGCVRIAYGPEPEDGLLLTGAQMQRFARATIEALLKPLEVLKWRDTP
jgi:hypothetical protein